MGVRVPPDAPVPVTTFLKVACGARENPGGYGTFSEATPQTTEQRGHYATKFISVWTGQQLQLGGDRGKAWPKHPKVSAIDENTGIVCGRTYYAGLTGVEQVLT